MKALASFGLAALILGTVLVLAQIGTEPLPESLEALAAAPENHRVLFEDENLRLLEITVEPGATEPMHGHKWPAVTIEDSVAAGQEIRADGTVVDCGRVSADAPYPQVTVWGPQSPHSYKNTDILPHHLYRLEFKHLSFLNIPDIETQLECFGFGR